MKIRHNIYFVLLLALMVLVLPNVVNAEDTVEEMTVEEEIEEETEEETVYVAQIGDVLYETLEEAIRAADDSSIINLLGDGTLSFNPNKNLTFVGKGKISVKGSQPWNSYSAVLTLRGSGVTFEWDDDTNSWLMMALSGTINIEDGATMRFKFNSNSTATRNAIYMNAGSVINVKNGSHFEIIAETTTQAVGQGIQLDKANKSIINVTGGSTFLIDGTNRGYVNSPEIYVEDSNFTIQNCTSNASNGGKFTAINSKIIFYNNGGHGLSATTLYVKKSNVYTNKNAYYGITIGSTIEVDATSTIESNENGWGYTGGALRIYGSTSTGYFEAGAKVTLNNNHRNALENYGKTVFEDGVELTITGNNEPNNGAGVFNGQSGNLTLPANAIIMNNSASKMGGGVYNKGIVIIPNSVKLYNNHAEIAGDDIYNFETGTITFGDVGTDWSLDGEPDCTDKINGWYEDGGDITDEETGETTNTRWEAHDDTEITDYYDEVSSGIYQKQQLAVKAAHDKAKVIVHYINTRGEELTDNITIVGMSNLYYTTEEKEFDNYVLIVMPTNNVGYMTRDNDIDVYYIYTDEIGDEGEMQPPHTGVEEISVSCANYSVTLYFDKKRSNNKVNF